MSVKRWIRRRYDEAIARGVARQLGIALVAAGVIGGFLNPEQSAAAPALVAVGMYLIHIGIGKIEEDG